MDISNLAPGDIAKYIDHTCVKVDATKKDIQQTCEDAIKYKFHSVCVTPTRVEDAKNFLKEHIKDIALIAVIGFPFGFTTTLAKTTEAKEAVMHGATEIDMVVNINDIKDGAWDKVLFDIKSVVEAVPNTGVKVILEPGFLTEDELRKACEIASQAKVAFVKTATGYGPRGAELHDITVMKDSIAPGVKIKASGGIHDAETAIAMLKAGAERIGTSSGLDIIGVKDKTYKTDNKVNYNY